jgi:hypothetical protein
LCANSDDHHKDRSHERYRYNLEMNGAISEPDGTVRCFFLSFVFDPKLVIRAFSNCYLDKKVINVGRPRLVCDMTRTFGARRFEFFRSRWQTWW